MRQKLWLIPFLFTAFWAFPYSLKVQVVDKELGTPLEGVTLKAGSGTAGIPAVSTDAQGAATLHLPEGTSRTLVTATLPGYEPAKVYVHSSDESLKIALILAGVIQGQELVVERPKPQKDDAQAGVSQVVDRDQIKSTAQIGIVEDVMSTVKVMPGVGYTGGWNAMPSIRGGDPSETTAVLDGVYVLYPYHWGGAYSIFNPNMVESAKLSNGIISARYGRVMSGLLEVNSKTPDLNDPDPKVDASVSTTGLDLFYQSRLGNQAGFLAGGKMTWMEASFALAGQAGKFDQVPFIRDGYAKAFWKPDPRTEWSWNLFLGSDGIGYKNDSIDKTLTTNGQFAWNNLSAVSALGYKTLLDDSSYLHAALGYNLLKTKMDYQSTTNGYKSFDQNFINTFNPGTSGFTLKNLTSDGHETNTSQLFMVSADYDRKWGTESLVTWGLEESLETWDQSSRSSGWQDVYTASSTVPQYQSYTYSNDVNGNRLLQSALFSLWNFEFWDQKLKGEAGLRAEHFYMFNSSYSLNTLPVVNPRLRAEYVLVKNQGLLDSLSVTGGSGLYSKFPLVGNLFDAKYGLKDYQIGPDRSLFNVMGLEAQVTDGWKVSVEAYYKYYFSRFYIVPQNGNAGVVTYDIHDDGIGHAYGFDVLLQKKTSRYWDGWLTYSFVVARYMNPTAAANSQQTTESGDPLNTWYYPSYHRFHNLNLILDWKPWGEGFTCTLKASLASGAPKSRQSAIQSYMSQLPDGTKIERFYQNNYYDDELRSDFSCPVDIKLTWFGYYPGTKIRWEMYMGVENLTALVYSPGTNKAFNPWYGDTLSESGQADFNMPFPIPSFGFKISY